MNKNLTLITFLGTMALSLFSFNIAQAQCIPAAPVVVSGVANANFSLTNSFTAVPSGTVIELVTANPDDVFSIDLCGTNAAGWADSDHDSYVTILDANSAAAVSLGTIDDGCTTGAGPNFWGPSVGAWGATAMGTYYLYITDYGATGSGTACETTSGLTYDVIVNITSAGPCEAGVLTSPLTQTACLGTPDSLFTITLAASPAPVSDGGFHIFYDNTGTNGQGGIGAPVTITGYTAADFPYTGNEDLNGVLSSNNFPPLVGTWNVNVYAVDAAGNDCDSTAVFTVNFCPAGPCEAGVLTSPTSQVICEGSVDSTFTIALDGTQVADGDFELSISNDGTNGTGGTEGPIRLLALTAADFPLTYDSDLNGILSGQATPLPPLAGTWNMAVFALDASLDDCDSTAVTSVEFLAATDPACSGPVACPIPVNTAVEMTTTTTASFSWNVVPGATLYQVRYRIKGTTTWSVAGSGSSPRAVSGLQTKRNYQYKVRAQCADGSWSENSDVVNFYTSQCSPPTGVATTFTDLTRMRVRWDANPAEIKAKIRYRVQGGTWVTQNSADGNNFLWVNGLPSGATIQYKVRSNCAGNDWSEYSSPLQVVTLGTTRLSEVISETTLSPNPANEVLNLGFNTADASEVTITISDNLGKEVLSLNNTYQEGTQRETLDISRLASGYYFVTIRSNDNVETLKFVKSK